MITFKEFLRESEEDVYHKVPKQAAETFIEHCKQWADVDVPLYRLSTPSNGVHTMRTRVPRKRISTSQGGTREVQEFIFNQPGWEDYPDRLHSIFCSTQKDFAVGDVDDYSENLVVIYPFDGTKIAMTTEANDFNFINLIRIKGINETPVMNFQSTVNALWSGTVGKFMMRLNWKESLQSLKDAWLKDGKFDPTANGNEDYVENFEKATNTFKKSIEFLVEKAPEVWTPEYLGCEIVSPATIELPGKVREVWFSGKYLSIPYPQWKRFKEEVKALQNGEELPNRDRITVQRAP